MRRGVLKSGVCVILLLLANTLTFGQAITASLQGRVADTSGAVLPKATVSVTLGPDGKLLRSGERRGPRMVTGARPGMTPAELQDSLNIARARTPSTMISLDFGRDQALVENTGTPTPGDAIRGPIAVVDALEQLEHPLARAQHVAEVCAHK